MAYTPEYTTRLRGAPYGEWVQDPDLQFRQGEQGPETDTPLGIAQEVLNPGQIMDVYRFTDRKQERVVMRYKSSAESGEVYEVEL